MIDILKKCGYDNPIAVKLLDEINLEFVEQYTSQQLIDLVKQSGYPTTDKFEFLPGHKVTLLALPNFVDNYLEEKNSQTKNNKSSSAIQASSSKASSEVTDITVDNIDILSEDEKEKLKTTLKSKIDSYLKKLDFGDLLVSLKDISSIDTCINRANKVVYKCSVKCPVCDHMKPCTFNKHWQISNLESHIRLEHGEGKKITSSLKEKCSKKAVSTTDAEIIHKVNSANENELSLLIDDDSSINGGLNVNGSMYIPLSESFKNAVTIEQSDN